MAAVLRAFDDVKAEHEAGLDITASLAFFVSETKRALARLSTESQTVIRSTAVPALKKLLAKLAESDLQAAIDGLDHLSLCGGKDKS